MAQNERDYYETLRVTQKAAKAEIDRAYLARKQRTDLSGAEVWELERAYATLSDPNLKRRYDSERERTEAASKLADSLGKEKKKKETRRPVRLGETKRTAEDEQRRNRVLVGLLAALSVILVAVIWWQVGWRFRTFDVGSRLVYQVDGRPAGEVVEYSESHSFPRGVTAPAYRIRLDGNSEARWLSKSAANRLFEPAP